jgi:membrane-bound lytic murein transglycosylase B
MNRKTIGVALALSMLPLAALAQSTTPQKPADTSSVATSESREKYRTACAADVQKFCAGIEKAKGATRACLDTNAAQLSDTCKAARSERAAARSKEKS